MTAVVWIVVRIRSGWKIRTTDIFGSCENAAGFAFNWRCRSSHTGLSGTFAVSHSVRNAGMIAIQNITRHAVSGVPVKIG